MQTIASALRKEALEASIVTIVLALNFATLTVLVLLATGISGRAAAGFCIVVALASAVCLLLRGHVLKRGRFDIAAEYVLIIIALLMAGAWGSLAIFAMDFTDPHAAQLLLALLTCGGPSDASDISTTHEFDRRWNISSIFSIYLRTAHHAPRPMGAKSYSLRD